MKRLLGFATVCIATASSATPPPSNTRHIEERAAVTIQNRAIAVITGTDRQVRSATGTYSDERQETTGYQDRLVASITGTNRVFLVDHNAATRPADSQAKIARLIGGK